MPVPLDFYGERDAKSASWQRADPDAALIEPVALNEWRVSTLSVSALSAFREADSLHECSAALYVIDEVVDDIVIRCVGCRETIRRE